MWVFCKMILKLSTDTAGSAHVRIDVLVFKSRSHFSSSEEGRSLAGRATRHSTASLHPSLLPILLSIRCLSVLINKASVF